jgi:hypothetical protein
MFGEKLKSDTRVRVCVVKAGSREFNISGPRRSIELHHYVYLLCMPGGIVGIVRKHTEATKEERSPKKPLRCYHYVKVEGPLSFYTYNLFIGSLLLSRSANRYRWYRTKCWAFMIAGWRISARPPQVSAKTRINIYNYYTSEYINE